MVLVGEHHDVYQRITESIAQAVERGTKAYEMPWHRSGGLGGTPHNARTKRPYSGVNVLALWVAGYRHGYTSALWATYRQWQALEAHVRKGEKGTPIIFYKKFEPEAESEGAEPKKNRPRIFARTSFVFNSAQVEGYCPKEPAPPRNLVQIIEEAERVALSTGADIRHEGDMAIYMPIEDCIYMPEKERFKGTSTSTPTESYYSVLFHELTHWTRHETRLNRMFEGPSHAENRAMEELVAELGAAFLCADIGVSNIPRPDHAAYVANWLQAMRNDTRAIFSASRMASEAADYLMKRGKDSSPIENETTLFERDDLPFIRESQPK